MPTNCPACTLWGGAPQQLRAAGDVQPCPANPPPPAGYRVWQRKGGVPAALGQWAVDLIRQSSQFPYGQTWQMPWGGETIIARKDHHTWTWRAGVLVQGICIPGITLYEPIPEGEGLDAGDRTLVGLFNDPNYDASGPGPIPWGWILAGIVVGVVLAKVEV